MIDASRPPGLPDYSRITADGVRLATDRGLAAADASLARMRRFLGREPTLAPYLERLSR
jgi:hypothetical protein